MRTQCFYCYSIATTGMLLRSNRDRGHKFYSCEFISVHVYYRHDCPNLSFLSLFYVTHFCCISYIFGDNKTYERSVKIICKYLRYTVYVLTISGVLDSVHLLVFWEHDRTRRFGNVIFYPYSAAKHIFCCVR